MASGGSFFLETCIEERASITFLKRLSGFPTSISISSAMGRTSPSLTEKAAKEALPVTFHGRLIGETLKEVVSRASVAVLPSRLYENAPVSILEAFALGKPVVGADIGGIPELIEEGGDGLLFEPENADRSGGEHSQNPRRTGLAEEMGRRGRRKLRRNFRLRCLVKD